MKEIFDKRSKERRFMIGYLVLKWDSRRETKGKHKKLDNLWLGPLQVIAVQDNNIYDVAWLDGEAFRAPVKEKFLKKSL